MKRLSLFLTTLFLLALFSGCGGAQSNTGDVNDSSDSNSAGTNRNDSGESTDTDTPAETKPQEISPYNLAKGKWVFNEDGLSSSKFDYDLPLSTTDEVFTRWTSCYTPQFIPEDGWASIPTWAELERMTGVHIEYNTLPSSTRGENFSVLLASNALLDIMDQGWFFYTSGTIKDAIYTEKYFENLYPYREYMPNYLYEIWNRSHENGKFNKKSDVYQRTFYEDDLITGFVGMTLNPAPGFGYWLRQDYMDKLNLGKASDITTFDELHDVLLAIKAEYNNHPFAIFSTIESQAGIGFPGYNTAAYAKNFRSYIRVVNGEVQFCGTTDDDRDLMTMLNQWYTEGLIPPNYSTYENTQKMTAELNNGDIAAVVLAPPAVEGWIASNVDPNCKFEAIPRTKKTDDQILQYGQKISNFHYGSCAISTNCKNVPLVVSYWDYWFSDEGCDFTSWGPEGYIWEYDENGKRKLTDWCLNHEAGSGWIMMIYGNSGLMDACLMDDSRSYAYEGGEVLKKASEIWRVSDYGGKYDWPTSVDFTDEQNEELTALATDLNTYFTEHYISFLDGSTPMAGWDEFITGLNSFGLDRFQTIYQEAYETFMKS